MNKNELIEAIQQTIVPNGKKGITAESLANLLMEMVNATPEGGSGGSGQIVFYAGMPTGETHEALEMPIFEPTPEQKAHNVEMFNTVKSLPYMPTVSVDLSEYYATIMGADVGIDVTGLRANATTFLAMYIPKELAQLEGLGQEAISISGILECFIFADGTLTLGGF